MIKGTEQQNRGCREKSRRYGDPRGEFSQGRVLVANWRQGSESCTVQKDF